MTLVRIAPLGRHRGHVGSTRQELARSGECVELGAARGRARTPAEGAPSERIFCVNPQDEKVRTAEAAQEVSRVSR